MVEALTTNKQQRPQAELAQATSAQLRQWCLDCPGETAVRQAYLARRTPVQAAQDEAEVTCMARLRWGVRDMLLGGLFGAILSFVLSEVVFGLGLPSTWFLVGLGFLCALFLGWLRAWVARIAAKEWAALGPLPASAYRLSLAQARLAYLGYLEAPPSLPGPAYDDSITDPASGAVFGVVHQPPSPEVLRQIKTRYGEIDESAQKPQPSATVAHPVE